MKQWGKLAALVMFICKEISILNPVTQTTHFLVSSEEFINLLYSVMMRYKAIMPNLISDLSVDRDIRSNQFILNFNCLN